jgi:hypothetical protein
VLHREMIEKKAERRAAKQLSEQKNKQAQGEFL